jgi:hypothetical protein
VAQGESVAKIRFDFKPVSLPWPAGDKFRIRFDYESHNQEAYKRLIEAISRALVEPTPEKDQRASAIGFSHE